MTTLKTLTETVEELGKDAKESIEELGRSAGEKLGEVRNETAGALHTAASSLRTACHQGAGAIDQAAAAGANKLHDLCGLFSRLRGFASNHLAGSLAAAAAIGFLAGSAFRLAPHARGNAWWRR